MSFSDVKNIIDINVFPNGMNLVTAAMVNTAITALLNETEAQIGDASTLLIGRNLVNAVNELFANQGASVFPFEVYNGFNSPDVTPPSSFNVGDFYIENGLKVYQFSDGEWVPIVLNLDNKYTGFYLNITAFLADQANQKKDGIYLVQDASDDSNLVFEATETRRQAAYMMTGTGDSDSLADYTLISAPYANTSAFETTDLSLHLDETTRELRGNVGQVTQVFIADGVEQDFELTHEPNNIIYIFAGSRFLGNDLTEWNYIEGTNTIRILIPLAESDRITINYQFIITQ